MIATRFRIATFALFALACSPLARASAQEAGLPLGTMAPAVRLETLDGKPADLAAYIGKTPVVLEFWATWCPLCRKLEPQMEAARKAYAGKVTFIGIGVPESQTPEKQQAYVDEKKLGGLYLFDREGAAYRAYKSTHTSYVVVLDAAGKVVYTGVGGDQKIDAAVAKAFPMKGGM